MTNQSSQEFESYVPVYDAIPEKWEDAQEFLVERLKELANAVNIREIGWYIDEELLSGKSFTPVDLPPGDSTPQQFRSILRKVIDFGSVAPIGIPVGIKEVPHGITFDTNFTLISITGAATDPTALEAMSLGYVSAGLNDIELYMDKDNIVTVCPVDYQSFTRVFIVVEYIQEI